MSVTDIAIAVRDLPRGEKARLLCQLAYQLGVAARGVYTEDSSLQEQSSKQLRGYNEIQLIVNSELDAALDDSSSSHCSSDDLIESLQHWARLAEVSDGLDWACKMALSAKL